MESPRWRRLSSRAGTRAPRATLRLSLNWDPLIAGASLHPRHRTGRVPAHHRIVSRCVTYASYMRYVRCQQCCCTLPPASVDNARANRLLATCSCAPMSSCTRARSRTRRERRAHGPARPARISSTSREDSRVPASTARLARPSIVCTAPQPSRRHRAVLAWSRSAGSARRPRSLDSARESCRRT